MLSNANRILTELGAFFLIVSKEADTNTERVLNKKVRVAVFLSHIKRYLYFPGTLGAS